MGHKNFLNKFKILQWNARSILHKYTEFAIQCVDFDFVVVSET